MRVIFKVSHIIIVKVTVIIWIVKCYVNNTLIPAVFIKNEKRQNIIYYILPFLSIFISMRQIIRKSVFR